jgi:rRNA maturation RNase YbeY
MHDRVINNKNYALKLYEINDNSLKRITDKWHEFKDSGDDFLNNGHRYSYDLDIFGKGSLFQLINTSSTMYGRRRLSEILSNTPNSKAEVISRQEAIQELTKILGWRQNLEAEGKLIPDASIDTERMMQWAKSRKSIYGNKWLIIALRVLPALTIVMFLISVSTALIPYYFYMTTLILQIVILLIKITDKSRTLQEVYTYKDSIKAYSRMLELIEKKNFKFDIDENGNLFIGSIAICSKRAKEQAIEYNHSEKREIYYLTVHGILHLLGYDHITDEDKAQMRELEERILTQLNITRDN